MILLLLIVLIFLLIEASQKLDFKSPLTLKPYDWSVEISEKNVSVQGWLEINNLHTSTEVMVPNLNIKPVLLGQGDLQSVMTIINIKPHPKDLKCREDDYWQAYIIKPGKSLLIEVVLDIKNSQSNNKRIDNLWLEIEWVNYGPFGYHKRKQGFSIPIEKSGVNNLDISYEKNNGFTLIPIKTHMLGILDNPVDVLKKYTSGILQNGDIITIGESPLAIVQGRYIDPSSIRTSILSKLLCKGFQPTSSLATACGMQSLINTVGPSRVIISWIIGAIGKTIFIKGLFYRLAGEQARLIDDVTGSTPPYDKSIVFGPIDTRNFCKVVSQRLGVSVAIVDVNDLGRVKVLATNKKCNVKLLKRALRSNPAGNDNEQTPIVIVRPS